MTQIETVYMAKKMVTEIPTKSSAFRKGVLGVLLPFSDLYGWGSSGKTEMKES